MIDVEMLRPPVRRDHMASIWKGTFPLIRRHAHGWGPVSTHCDRRNWGCSQMLAGLPRRSWSDVRVAVTVRERCAHGLRLVSRAMPQQEPNKAKYFPETAMRTSFTRLRPEMDWTRGPPGGSGDIGPKRVNNCPTCCISDDQPSNEASIPTAHLLTVSMCRPSIVVVHPSRPSESSIRNRICVRRYAPNRL